MLRATLKVTLWILAVVALLLSVVLLTALTNTPLPKQPATLTADSAQSGHNLVKRLVNKLENAHRAESIHIGEKEVDALLAVAQRGYPNLGLDSRFAEGYAQFSLRYTLPSNPFFQFWGFGLIIPPFTDGVRVETIQWGNFEIPGDWLIPTVLWFMEQMIGDRKALAAIVASFRKIEFQDGKATLSLQSDIHLGNSLSTLMEKVKTFSSEQNLFTNSQLAQHYFGELIRIEQTFTPGSTVALEAILLPYFQMVSLNSVNEDPVEHNRAALIAMGVYLGTYHFEKLVGRIAPKDYKAHLIPIKVVLAERKDLLLHFVYSATLQLLTDQGASFSIGEFKELLDSNTGGSGFSFADLTADRAGILFAQRATANETSARAFQQRVIEQAKAGLLPPVTEFQEGLSKGNFTALFGDIDSAEYQQEINRIDQQLHRLPLFSAKP